MSEVNVKKKALWLSLLGFALGMGVGLLFYFLRGEDGYLARKENRPDLILYFAFCGVFGAVNMGTSALYDIEEWSILRCTATHFAICLGSTVLFFGALILLDWMSMPPAAGIAVMGAAFVTVYFFIWLMQYLSYKREVRKINAKLRQWKSKRSK